MSKLNAVIIDDEPLAHEVICEYVKELPFIEITGQFYASTKALADFKSTKADLLFLDINMPKLNGIELIKLLDDKPQVIITSAHKEYALEGYELDVCDYLLKPIRYSRFLKAVQKAQQIYQLKQSAVVAEIGQVVKSHIVIRVDREQLQLPLKDILYLESYGNYVKVWQQDKCLLTQRTLTSFEQELAGCKFARIHKSFMLNMAQLKSVGIGQVTLSSGQQLPVGKRFRNNVKLV